MRLRALLRRNSAHSGLIIGGSLSEFFSPAEVPHWPVAVDYEVAGATISK